ncbi:unnamed protein product [Musa textilis]
MCVWFRVAHSAKLILLGEGNGYVIGRRPLAGNARKDVGFAGELPYRLYTLTGCGGQHHRWWLARKGQILWVVLACKQPTRMGEDSSAHRGDRRRLRAMVFYIRFGTTDWNDSEPMCQCTFALIVNQ